ncbi:MAG: trypsin-like peptidase domain-containing protein [Clostridia bacterium]|nr:trypsin-like peptidase domain-containing protein [Clostridia bacterium]
MDYGNNQGNGNYSSYNPVPGPGNGGSRQPSGSGKRHFVIGIILAVVVTAVLVGSVVAGAFAAFYLVRVLPTIGGTETSENPQGEVSRIADVSEESRPAAESRETVKREAKIRYAEDSGKQEKSYAEVYAENVSSTVGITTSITTNYFGFRTTSAASGSGFFLTEDGYVLTNYHVVEGATSIKVTAYDDTSYTAELIGYSEANDIAILKVDASGVAPVTIGRSADMVVGDLVAAIGNPLGELTFSLTSGVVSALNRSVTTSSGSVMKLIQTDCAINSGNSGGALFNMYGEVIGITNAKYAGSVNGSATIDNIGFAIPIDSVISLVRQIIEDGYVLEPYIGVSAETVSNAAVRYGYPQGAYVEMVARDGEADRAGIRQGDIITELNGVAVTGRASLISAVAECKIGSTVPVKIYRDGKTIELSVVIGQKRQSLTGGTSSSYT